METKLSFYAFKEHFEPFKVFSVQDILKWNSAFDTRRLVEWQDKGYLIKIVNRWYAFAGKMHTNQFFYLTANRIYSPSYVSLESAWAHYGLIPEGVYSTTSITSLKTHTFHTSIGTFSYRHLKNELLFGYRLVEVEGEQWCKIAEPEKLVLDHLYLNTSLKSPADFEAMRINHSLLKEQLNLATLEAYLKIFESKALEKRIRAFYKTYSL